MTKMETMLSWVDLGLIRYVDYALVKFVREQVAEQNEDLLLALLLTSHSVSLGQVCLDLDAVLATPTMLFNQEGVDSEERQQGMAQLQNWLADCQRDTWLQSLRNCPAVADEQNAYQGDQAATPFVLVEQQGRALLYLRRYWQAERTIVEGIKARLEPASRISNADIKRLLSQLFGEKQHDFEETDWQRIACGIAASNHFSIITGGPGTGKTTTVLKLLALLQAERLLRDLPPLAIRLAAPTGKAAARLNESIAQNLSGLALPDLDNLAPEKLKAVIPTQVMTLHRLLSPKPNSRQFQHNKSNPLVADIVVVDEASMIDIEMMANLFDGIEADTRVILLGDKDQLASVEAGYVLGDLCRGAVRGHYTPDTAQWIEEVCQQTIDQAYIDAHGTTLNQAVCMLRKSYRFVEGGVIHRLASLVNEEREQAHDNPKWPDLQAIFQRQESIQNRPVLQYLEQAQQDNTALSEPFKQLLLEGYGHYLAVTAAMPELGQGTGAFDDWGKQVLAAHAHFQLLVALRKGDWGVEGMNHKIEQLLVAHKRLASVDSVWYFARPVMVTQNDYSVDLMNGDIGISLLYPVNGALKQRVVFSDGKGGVRWVLPSRLQSVETVFAMTVHKSQGSEFHHTAMLLPSQHSPILTKELIYTGITRSKKHFTLIAGDKKVLESAMNSKVERVSGLGFLIQ
ncbi:exodeoxyribonuclease V subunit alpha [Marinomonas ostreistagni]|uniref:exodeoxyribonuclease V subunit alpha n=1 Tax=Marinomonas ostreistagni TaxID=359209 RepID=UPI0019510038|nr:exodeoxyribonuclease V subunit alpha [Marinomonas ostreistagni]MBM6550515.1 exodeoxyribonuclease V subunit alpha [Marinomonas ostreistagni]